MKRILLLIFLFTLALSSYSQSVDGAFKTLTASGTNTYTITEPTPSTYSNKERFLVRFTNANTGAATLNRSGLGAKDIKKADGSALSAGDIQAGGTYLLSYNGTYYQIVGGGGGGVTDHGALTGLGDDDHPQYLLRYEEGPLANPQWQVWDTTNDYQASLQMAHDLGLYYYGVKTGTNDAQLSISNTEANLFNQMIYFQGYDSINLISGGSLNLQLGSSGSLRAKLSTSTLTAPRTFQFPNASGTLALTSDIPGSFTLSNGSGTTASGSSVNLGGALTQNANFTGNYSFKFGNSSNRLKRFSIYADSSFHEFSGHPSIDSAKSLIRATPNKITLRNDSAVISEGTMYVNSQIELTNGEVNLSGFHETNAGNVIVNVDGKINTESLTINKEGASGSQADFDASSLTGARSYTLPNASGTIALIETLPNHTLDSHSNVIITGNTAGEILKWGGSAWVNNTLAEAGIQPAGTYATGTGSASGTNTGDQSLTHTSDATSHTLTLTPAAGSLKLIEGSNITLTTSGNEVTIASTAGGTGDVTGPASSVDNTIARFDLTTGKIIQASDYVLTDNAGVFGLGLSTTSGTIRNINANGSSTDVDLALVSKNAGDVSLTPGNSLSLLRIDGDGSTIISGNLTNTVQLNSATTNATIFPSDITAVTSGTPATGIGTGVRLITETSPSNNEIGATIESITTDATAASEDFDLVFKTMAAGAAASERLRIKSTGDIQFSAGTSGVSGQVLTSNGSGAAPSWQAVPAASVSISTQTGTTYTLVSGDNGTYIEFTNASPITVTLPNGLASNFTARLIKKGAGNITISATGTLESDGTTIEVQHTYADVYHKGSNVWTAAGSLGAPLTLANISGTLNADKLTGTASDGVKITFNPDATNAGVNVGAHSADPSSLANGDLWVGSTNTLKARTNGQTGVVMGVTADPTDTQIPYANANKVYTASSSFTFDGTRLRSPEVRLEDKATPSASADGSVLFGEDLAGRSMLSVKTSTNAAYQAQPHFGTKAIAKWEPAGNSTTITATGAAALTATGTATAANVATTNIHTWQRGLDFLVTTPAATAVAGWRAAANQWAFSNAAGLGGFHMICRWGPATGVSTSTSRAFVGMSTNTGAPTDVEPSSLTNMFGMGWDAADANIQFMRNDGTGTATKTDLGSSFPVPTVDRTDSYEIHLFAAPNSTTIYYEIVNMTDGSNATGNFNTDLPAVNTFMSPRGYMSVGGTSSVVGIKLMKLYIESDY